MTAFHIVIEDAGSNFSAFAPDVPGCVATGQTVDEVKANMATALSMHCELMRETGEAIPAPSFRTGTVTVSV